MSNTTDNKGYQAEDHLRKIVELWGRPKAGSNAMSIKLELCRLLPFLNAIREACVFLDYQDAIQEAYEFSNSQNGSEEGKE